MKKLLLISIVLFAAIYGLGRLSYVRDIEPKELIQSVVEDFGKFKDEVVHGEPLRISGAFLNKPLTPQGIVSFSNVERNKEGVASLGFDVELSQIASLRLEDMFTNQYFEHVSPIDDGDAASEAKVVGYEYVIIGENLALGSFDGDAGVVDAWMKSPGHRANILDPRFTMLGVAAREGIFEGEKVWIAVQIFAKPLSECPSPDPSLKLSIDSYTEDRELVEEALVKIRKEIEGNNPRTEREVREHNEKVDEYNRLVSQYEALQEKLVYMIDLYNDAITKFNTCIQES